MQEDLIHKIRGFNRFYTKILGITNNHILESDYSLTEVRVLFEIQQEPNIKASTIKEFLQLDEGYLSRLISKLIKQKMLVKKKSSLDKRASTLILSSKGKQILMDLNKKSSANIEDITHHLNENEQLELVSYFESIRGLLNKQP